jgi:hypothetical protein
MAEYSPFLNRLRHDLGKRFTVAEEHTTDPQKVNLLVLRQRHDDLLTVVADARWLALQGHEDSPVMRVEYKHLVVAVRNYFARPAALPPALFHWPGTQESREEVRRALSRRKRAVSD